MSCRPRRELSFGLQLHVYSVKVKQKSSPDSVGEDQCGGRMKGRHHSLLTPESCLQYWQLHGRLGNHEGQKQHFRIDHSLRTADAC